MWRQSVLQIASLVFFSLFLYLAVFICGNVFRGKTSKLFPNKEAKKGGFVQAEGGEETEEEEDEEDKEKKKKK